MFGAIDCPSCGEENSASVSYCEYCGATLRSDSSPTNDPVAHPAPKQPVNVNQALGISAQSEEPVQRSKPETRTAPTQPSSSYQSQDLSPSNRETKQLDKPGSRAAQIMNRYWDGYIHARAIDTFGGVVKVIALLIGGLLVLGGIIYSADSRGFLGALPAIMIVLSGLIIGGIGYILGVLVQSAGQSMKAHFDCAVYQSRFLNDDQRAKVMSLD